MKRKRDAHTGGSTTSRRLPVRRDVPCDLRQQQQIQVMLFRSTGIVLAALPFLFFRPASLPPSATLLTLASYPPVYVPDCLPACLPCLLHFLTCCPIFLGVFPRARSYLHPPCNAVLHVRLEIYSLYTAYTWSYLYFREDRPSAGQKFQIISLELLQLLK